MQLLELTLPSAAENLALDEALLETAEAAFDGRSPHQSAETLRIWEPREYMVVVGSSSRMAEEVNLEPCQASGVPVLRRASGGCAIVAGPGCLMYSVVLGYRNRAHLRSIDQAHRYVLDAIAGALNQTTGLTVKRDGISDLVWNDRKVSGNSLRCKRNYFLYHGTLLYDFELSQVSSLLKIPQRQPEYRRQRSHDDFIANLPVGADTLRQALIAAFQATDATTSWPVELTARLAQEKYARDDWNSKL